MNLDQIATKCFILALFIRDDGQRLLLGDGYYDFNQKLQHFQSNTIANDVVEIQGDSGQLLAGQVMRSGAQKFEGYIGDATTNCQTIEQKRSDFMAFFRIKHFYKVIYIFPDGTAIQRQRGYLTDAPTIPEIFQRFPEYSVALNFEDANYYEYAEDAEGNEIYAHIAELALSENTTGGLIWDAIGAVTNGITWSGIQTAQGEYISITNELSLEAPLASVEMLGKAEQTTYSGKNLIPNTLTTGTTNGLTYTPQPDGTIKLTGRATARVEPYLYNNSSAPLTFPAGTYKNTSTYPIILFAGDYNLFPAGGSLTFSEAKSVTQVYFRVEYTGTTLNETYYPQIIASTTTDETYEKYVGGTASPNPDYPQAVNTVTGEQTVKIEGKNLFDKDSAVAGLLNRENGQIWTSSTYMTSDYIKVEAGRTYTSTGFNNWYRAGFNAQKQWTSLLPESDTFTIPNGVSYIRTSVSNANLDTAQLELGSQASEYQAYQAQEFEINLGSIELAKIGNYQDRIFKADSKWYIEKQVGKVVLDGDESWYLGQTLTNTVHFNIGDFTTIFDGIKVPTDDTQLGLCMSNYFEEKANLYNIDQVGIDLHVNKNLIVGVPNSIATTTANFKTWLSTHPTTVYYALATPTTTEITNEALIAQLDALGASSLYVGVNNIGTETQNAMPTLKIEYYTEVDLDGAGYEWEPGGNTAKTIVTVAGVDSAWPVWTVQGGAQNPTLTNITTGQTITWQGFVPEGQTLTINMAEMTADLAGANVFEYITGEWLRLAPGNNTLVYNAGNADKSSTLSWNGVLA